MKLTKPSRISLRKYAIPCLAYRRDFLTIGVNDFGQKADSYGNLSIEYPSINYECIYTDKIINPTTSTTMDKPNVYLLTYVNKSTLTILNPTSRKLKT